MSKNITIKQFLLIGALAMIVIQVIAVLSTRLPKAVDWYGAFRPAALLVLQGRSPYNADGFFNPPWAAILLIPFAVLPENIGRATMIVATIISYAYIAHKLGAKKIVILVLLLSPPVLHEIINGNLVNII